MTTDEPPERSLRRALPEGGPARVYRHVIHRCPRPHARLRIDGQWRDAVIGGWSQAGPGAPVIIHSQWSDGRHNFLDTWIHEPDLVIGSEDIWGPNPPA
ncbi:hypothetical protein [Streptomyces sp. SID3343]|uniref:hypothetical protein n=1 Tax=Streptomyces sp. SID3343 TaxID=2690260 RepID=UPI00136BAFD6|nr:hypothetical protein [Streptomyces sp. SID3343]MYW00995.1 hypothetical protein [Streptomyces sp. SID3343]